jgi:3-hydroxybutyryl-CoA dehydrogenase
MLDIQRSDLIAGVAGSGTMGRGIAQVLAQCGVRTLLFDAKPGAAKILAILEAMFAIYQEPRYRPSPWLRRRAKLGVSLRTPE